MNKIKFFIILLILILLCSLLFSCKNHESEISYIGFGGQQTVGGSMHCLEVDKKLYMVDAGIFYEDDSKNYILPNEIDINNLQAVFITHAHADHIGRIPLLLQNGYSGPIFMTGVTYDIAKIMLSSSLKYSKFNISEYELLKKLKQQVIIVNYNEAFYVNNKVAKFFLSLHIPEKLFSWFIKDLVRVEFLYTSHIPGSAMVELNINGKDIVFSGDIGSDNNPFLKKNNSFKEHVDYLFLEGTYGFKEDNSNSEAKRKEFQQIIGNKLKEGFRVIIPAFVLDRTQQVLYEIKDGMDKNIIPNNTIVKAYSPTSEKITDLYKHYFSNIKSYESFFSKEILENSINPQSLIYNSKKNDGSYDTKVNYGEIAVMSSGMSSFAFSKEAINTYIEDPKTFIMIVGYQAEDTVGWGLIEASENEKGFITIDEVEKKIVQDNIYRTYAFNSHADITQIMNIFKNTSPKEIFLVHLDKEVASDMLKKYQEEFASSEIIAPSYGEKYELK